MRRGSRSFMSGFMSACRLWKRNTERKKFFSPTPQAENCPTVTFLTFRAFPSGYKDTYAASKYVNHTLGRDQLLWRIQRWWLTEFWHITVHVKLKHTKVWSFLHVETFPVLFFVCFLIRLSHHLQHPSAFYSHAAQLFVFHLLKELMIC